jgi:hypothetical protein
MVDDETSGTLPNTRADADRHGLAYVEGSDLVAAFDG